MNDIKHSLGLYEIEAAVEKGAFGKLTGLGEASPLIEDRFQYPMIQETAAMEVQLRDMLTRIAMGCTHQDQAGVVNWSPVRLILNLTKIEMVRMELFPRRSGEKELSDDAFRVRATNSDNGDPTMAWGGRNSGNRIMLVHNRSRASRPPVALTARTAGFLGNNGKATEISTAHTFCHYKRVAFKR